MAFNAQTNTQVAPDNTADHQMWCKVCEHYGNNHETCASHTTRTVPDFDAIQRVTSSGYMILRDIKASTQCPVLQKTVCPNRNCFNFGQVTEPTLGHSRSYCPCAWDQEIPAWEAKMALQQHQQMLAQQAYFYMEQQMYLQNGIFPQMSQFDVDSHFDPDQIEVENFLEDRIEQQMFLIQDDFARQVAEHDWLETEEWIIEADRSH